MRIWNVYISCANNSTLLLGPCKACKVVTLICIILSPPCSTNEAAWRSNFLVSFLVFFFLLLWSFHKHRDEVVDKFSFAYRAGKDRSECGGKPGRNFRTASELKLLVSSIVLSRFFFKTQLKDSWLTENVLSFAGQELNTAPGLITTARASGEFCFEFPPPL